MKSINIERLKNNYKTLRGISLIISLLIIVFGGISYWSNREFSTKQCLEIEEEKERIDCYGDIVSATLQRDGIQEAFSVVKNFYQNDPSFATSCHEFTHLIGEEAYKKFKQESKFEVVPETYYCGYGFYHGFIIKLMSSGDDLSLAQQFCMYTDRAINENSQTTQLDCYHGIGHGVTDYSSTELLGSGKEQVLIDNSVALCEEVSSSNEQLLRCIDGIFHSIGDIYLSDPDYMNSKDEQDPMALCRRQNIEHRKVCYGAMGYLVMQNFKEDFDKALGYASQIEEPEYAKALIRPMAGYRSYSTLGIDKNGENITSCSMLDDELAKECLMGLVEGITDFGTPGKEHEEVVRFCRTEGSPAWVADFCLDHAVKYFGSYFGQEKKSLLCSLAGPRVGCKT